MDKAIIVGTYEFLGFHLCKKLLEDGYEVIGIHCPFREEELYKEEKNLEIGRNGNFFERGMDDWETNIDEPSILFIDYYDFFMRRVEGEFHKIFHEKNLSNYKQMMILLPQTLLMNDSFIVERKNIESSLERVDCKKIYLPTIFGPWQGEMFSFQQRLKDKNRPIIVDEREWQGDAIDVEDAVKTIVSLFQSSQSEILLSSEEGDGWTKCAKLLSLPYKEIELNNKICVYKHIVKQSKDIKVSLENQQRMIDYLKDC